jgi:hypothetical protein
MSRRLLPAAAVLTALATAVPAAATTDQLPAPPLAGTRSCAPAPFVRALREKGTSCHRARQVSHFWERGGHCPAGWTEKRYALPAGVEATGGSYLSCRHGGARVLWAEHGE